MSDKIDGDFIGSREFIIYDKIVAKLQINWRYQLTVILVSLTYAYEPDNAKDLLGFFKIPIKSFEIFVAYFLPVIFVYFGFLLGRYILSRSDIEKKLLSSKLVSSQKGAANLSDGLFIFDIIHRQMVLNLSFIERFTHGLTTLFAILVISCNHVLSFKYALDVSFFTEDIYKYISNTVVSFLVLLCYMHFIFILPEEKRNGIVFFVV